MDTRRAAFHAIMPTARTLRDRCVEVLADMGPMTADEVAAVLGKSVLSIRPRMTELANDNKIEPTGDRRENTSGREAVVWRLAS